MIKRKIIIKYFLPKVLLLIMLLVVSCKGRSFKIDKDEISSMAIVVPDTANSIVLLAADELKKHIYLIFDKNIAISDFSDKDRFRKRIFIEIKPDSYEKKLDPEKSVYIIKRNSIYIF